MLEQILNIFDSYGSSDAAKGDLGVHRLIEAIKHMFAVRMNLGDPDFVNISKYENDMLSPDFAKHIRERIFDNTTFPPEYYMSRYYPFSLSHSDKSFIELMTFSLESHCLMVLLRSLFSDF